SLSLLAEVVAEGGGQGGEGQLVRPQRPRQRVAFELGDDLLPADEQAGLGAAKQLVAAEGHQRGAGGGALLARRLLGPAEGRGGEQGAAAQVVQDWQPMPSPDLDQLGEVWLVDKARQAKVAGVDAQQQGRLGGNGALEIGRVGAVGGAYLDQLRAALAQDIR